MYSLAFNDQLTKKKKKNYNLPNFTPRNLAASFHPSKCDIFPVVFKPYTSNYILMQF
jgi:hypothetical protein